MNRSLAGNDLVVPEEFRSITERMFPQSAGGQWPNQQAIVDFSKSLGIKNDFERLLALDKKNNEIKVFMEHFQNNLNLLIQKTWVEKADETRKEKLQKVIPSFIVLIENENFDEALDIFGEILDELAYLFFGVQSTKNDFTEYTFRIDTEMGLFWWYGGKLISLKKKNNEPALNSADKSPAGAAASVSKNNEILWAVLLIGLCYLTNF